MAAAAAALVMPPAVVSQHRPDPDRERLTAWTGTLRSERVGAKRHPFGRDAVRVGELAAGAPYVAGTLDTYLKAGGNASSEPLTLSLTRFDCVTLVESCLAVARVACGRTTPTWEGFGKEIERMRYRGGERRGYVSRLHYFSEWISNGARRGLVRDVGRELGGQEDARPLRFMSSHRSSYTALADDAVFGAITGIERALDGQPRWVIPKTRIADVAARIETGDVLAFATEIEGLDVTHSAYAYRGEDGVLRVLHAPLSGGVVAITRTTLPDYVAAIRKSTGILVARPLRG